jgi:hypothetical protein
MNLDSYSVERRSDGAVIVRVASRDRGRDTLPQAVFTFRIGDPQFSYWQQVLTDREASLVNLSWSI